MSVYIALLRGINVGGSGLLPMKELVELCSGLGFQSSRTYIQSGNVIFESTSPEASVRDELERLLAARMQKRIDVMVRTREEMREVLRENPFPLEEPAKVGVAFLGSPSAKDLMTRVIAPGGEQVRPGRREIYIYYPLGIGRSKLKLALDNSPTTIRNVNTVAKLVALSEA